MFHQKKKKIWLTIPFFLWIRVQPLKTRTSLSKRNQSPFLIKVPRFVAKAANSSTLRPRSSPWEAWAGCPTDFSTELIATLRETVRPRQHQTQELTGPAALVSWLSGWNPCSKLIILLCFLFLFFLAMPHGMWDLNPLIRDQTHTPCIGSAES